MYFVFVIILTLLSPENKDMQSRRWKKKQNRKPTEQQQQKPKLLKGTKRSHCHNILTIMLTNCKESTQDFAVSRLGC